MGRAVRCFGLSGRLEVDALIGYAQRKTGLADFGDDGWLRALKVLVDSINDEAGLTTTGQLIQRSRLAGALIQRLRIEEVLKRHPEVHDIDLGTIVMITGMQRTGTTLLQRLVNSHPGIRGVSGAEALDPVPAADPNDREAGHAGGGQPLRRRPFPTWPPSSWRSIRSTTGSRKRTSFCLT